MNATSPRAAGSGGTSARRPPNHSTPTGAQTAALRDVLAAIVHGREALNDGDLFLAAAAAETAELELAAVIAALEDVRRDGWAAAA